MNGDIDKDDDVDLDGDLSDDDLSDDDAVDTDDDMVDGVHEVTVVDADVESLVAKIDNTDLDEAARKREIRRKLDEASEKRSQKLDETFNFNIDDEL